MDPGMPMILPKGIVTNTEYIYEEVAEFPFVPPDKLWKYWHVYTTTHKKLRDPTAGRLENFWWHVWGSDRRFLKGSTLAKLYEDISVGPTAVPLRGPPNRWEGPDVPPLLRQIMEAVQAEEARRHQPSQQPQPSPKPREQALRTLSSSASKPPPSHPILKKARGPSSSGPRPTARFVSPHESDEEDDIPSSGSTAATGSEVPVYAVSPKKKVSTAPVKKHLAPVVAPTAKIRSLKPKRTQVHLPHNSEMPRERTNSAGSRQANVQSPAKIIVERPLDQVTSPSEESVSSFNSHEQPVMSEKARGKQPVKPLRSITELNGVPKQKQERRTSAHHEQPSVKRKEKPTLPQAQSLVDLTRHSRRSSANSRSTFGVGSLESGSTVVDIPPSMARSSSHTGYERSSSAARLPGIGLLTGATTSTSNIAAQGTILDQSGLSALPLPSIPDEIHHSISIQPPAPSILDSRFVPTQPTTAASVPLGRTKSQLTLLLEREKARTGNKPRSKS